MKESCQTASSSFLLRKLRLVERDLLELKEKSSQAVPIIESVLSGASRAVQKTVIVPEADDPTPKLIAEPADLQPS